MKFIRSFVMNLVMPLTEWLWMQVNVWTLESWSLLEQCLVMDSPGLDLLWGAGYGRSAWYQP